METKDDFFGAYANAIAGNGVNFNCQDSTELAHILVDEMGEQKIFRKALWLGILIMKASVVTFVLNFTTRKNPNLRQAIFGVEMEMQQTKKSERQ